MKWREAEESSQFHLCQDNGVYIHNHIRDVITVLRSIVYITVPVTKQN
jgi:hypothetical protein